MAAVFPSHRALLPNRSGQAPASRPRRRPGRPRPRLGCREPARPSASGVGVRGVALACRRRLLRGRRPLCRSARGRGLAAELAALVRGGMTGRFAATRAGFLAAPVVLVDGRPGAALGLLLGDAALLVALGDMVGLPLLLVGVFGFVAARHRGSSWGSN